MKRQLLFVCAILLLPALVHAQGRSLHHQHILVLIHNEAAQEVAFGVNHAEGGRARQVLLPHREGRADAFLEKRLVGLDSVG